MSLADFSIRRPITTAMFFTGVSLLGLISLDRLPVELMPEVVYPEIFVSLNLRGASPEQIERDLVLPVEAEIGKLKGVLEMESAATLGRGSVRVSYVPDADMKFALLQIESRMARLQPLFPTRASATVQRFDIADLSSSVMQLQVLGEGDLNWLRDFSEAEIRPALEAVDGVVNAAAMGGQQSAVEIIADPLLLQAHGLTMNQLNATLNAINRPRSYLGRVYDGSQAYPVSLQGQFTALGQIEQAMLKPEIPLRLGDVAQVRYGLQQRTNLNRINGKAAVGLVIQKEDEANLIAVAAAVEAVIERLNRDFAEEGVEILVINSQADLMNDALGTLKQAAVIGVGLGLVVLFLFLRNLRFVGVLLLAIPASLLLTFNLMYAWDLSINVLSLCGLALAMGMLTDNSIVVMESIFKHFEAGKTPVEAARAGAREVGRAVIAATATTVAVFLPVVFIQSDFQSTLRELALSITFPLLASLLVALSLVPCLAARTLRQDLAVPLATGRLLEGYTMLLKASLRHRLRLTLSIGIALTATVIAALFLMLQQEVVEEESQFTLYVDLDEGATLDATDEIVAQLETIVNQTEGVERFTTSVQEAQGSVTVILADRDERPKNLTIDAIKEQIEEQANQIQGGIIGDRPQARAGGGGGGRSGGMRRQSGGFNLLAGAPSEQAVIRGYDFATLQMIADDLTYRLEELEELNPNTVRADFQRSAPEVQIIPDALALFDQRLEINSILTAIEDANPEGFQTSTAFLRTDGTEVPIEVRTTEDPEAEGPDIEAVSYLPVASASGGFTPVAELAQVRRDEGRASIMRTDRSRRVIVSYEFTDEILDSQPRLDQARNLVRDLVQTLVLPADYSIEITEAESDTIYYWMMGVATVLIYMILAALFESLASPLIIFGTLPTAVIGSCWALMFSGTGLTSTAGPMALLGFIVLLGIAVNNGIILIDAIGTLRTQHGFRRTRAVLTASRSRVRPILMTSATTLLGVMPLALEFGGDYEIWPPFAITVLGGLTLSMFSTLVFIPVIYMGLDQVRAWLQDIGLIGVLLATLVTGAAGYLFFERYVSYLWTALITLPCWFTCLGLIWAIIQVHRGRAAAQRPAAPVQVIQLQTLTKNYGAPGRFKHEWARFERRATRLLAAGDEPLDRKTVEDSLGWKIPLLALLVYLHTYFEDSFWLYLLSLLTLSLLGHLQRCAIYLWRATLPGRIGDWARTLGRYLMPLLFLGYIHWRLDLLSVTVASAAVWLAQRTARGLINRMRRGRIDPQALSGRLAWLRKRVYTGAAALPLIGIAPPPFQALAGINLEIGRGMFGLLGPNGAGKTTLMRIICQVLEPSHGSVALDGVNIRQYGHLHGLIGYLPQHFGLYNHLSAYQYLEYRALLEGFRRRTERQERIIGCLDQVNLLDRKDDPIGSFSGGMRQRVGIAQTLLHMPQIIVVDEPTAGLDPIERIRFRNLLARVSQDRIVIFSTHIVEDISGSCNRLAVLNQGHLLYSGTPRSMRDLAHQHVWETVVPEAEFVRVERQLRLISHMRTPAGIRARFLAASPSIAAEAVEPTLEDAYIYLLEQGRRKDADLA
jgi:multidrug efflux pump subunit AcrB/ABC-type multidrug transport system ATPase subunit